ncbi:MAG: hypothetical protein RLZZ517_220 [Candidatus Parcubacteria bacterium]
MLPFAFIHAEVIVQRHDGGLQLVLRAIAKDVCPSIYRFGTQHLREGLRFYTGNLSIGCLVHNLIEYLLVTSTSGSNTGKRLRELFVSGYITEEEFNTDVRELDRFQTEEEERIARRSDWMTDAKKVLNLAVECEHVIKHGDPKVKKQAFRDLGSNLTWDGKNLSISNTKLVSGLLDTLKSARAENPLFEPEKCVDTSSRNQDFDAVRPTLCAG